MKFFIVIKHTFTDTHNIESRPINHQSTYLTTCREAHFQSIWFPAHDYYEGICTTRIISLERFICISIQTWNTCSMILKLGSSRMQPNFLKEQLKRTE